MVRPDFNKLRCVVLLTLVCVPSVSQSAIADVSTEQLAKLDAYIATEAARLHLPNVAYAVLDRDKIIQLKVLGQGVDPQHAFVIGSCSKSITALAALLACEQAELDLDTPIDRVLKSMSIANQMPAPTVRQLLQHRSGLERSQGFLHVPGSAEIQSDGYTLPIHFPPGEQYRYSNLNYALLGRVIESLSGEIYSDFVARHVFLPARMLDSSCGNVADNLAPSYQYCFGFPLQVERSHPDPSQIPAGFVCCSIRDFARFQLCLLNDGKLDGQQIFPAGLIQLMKAPAEQAEYGYGMGLIRGHLDQVGDVFGHEGATPCSYAFQTTDSERQSGIVLLTNINLFDPFTDHGETLYQNMLRILAGREPVMSPPYRIWIRWALIVVLAVSIGKTVIRLRHWKDAEWWLKWPNDRIGQFALLFEFILPIVIWILILRQVQIPLSDAIKMDPDIMLGLIGLTLMGMVTTVLKHCGSPPEQAKYKAKEID